MSLITCRELLVGYESHAILPPLNFEIDAGDYLCVVGKNGAGKSTLMRTLLGLQRPLGGTIAFGDGMSQNEIGYLPQQSAIQKDFPATVREIVLSGCQAHIGRRAFYGKAERALAEQSLERMGMADFARHCYRELSGGQQQRVLLARALCATRRLLLLDEPVSGLDPNATLLMYDLIGRLNRDGVTIVMISHDLAAAARYATRLLHLGGDVFFGSADEYRESPVGKRFPIESGPLNETAAEGGASA